MANLQLHTVGLPLSAGSYPYGVQRVSLDDVDLSS